MYLGREEVVGIRRVEDRVVGLERLHVLRHHVEGARGAHPERLVEAERVGPREHRIEAVARDVHVGVAWPQRDHTRLLAETGKSTVCYSITLTTDKLADW